MRRTGEGCAGAPTGFRRLTPGLLQADRTAEGFDGSAGRRDRARAVAGRLQGGGAAARPVAAPGACGRLAVPLHPAAGLGQGRAADRLALGLDAAGGARPVADAGEGAQPRADRGRADHHEGQPERQALRQARPRKGGIVEAYGFDLSPIAARHAEFVRLAEEAKAERAEMGRLRRRATIARNGITQILETAAEYGFAGRGMGAAWRRETRDLASALKQVERPEEMALGVESLERRQREARERLENLLAVPMAGPAEAVDSDPKGPENGPHQYTYKPSLNPATGYGNC